MSRLDILSISFLLVYLYRPAMIYQTSFILSFLIAFALCLSGNLLKTEKRLKRIYLVSSYCYIFSLPIVINLNNNINFLVLLVSPLFVLVFSILLIPLCFIVVFFPFLALIFEDIFILTNTIISYLSDIQFFSIEFKSLHILEILMYYVILCWIILTINSGKKQFKIAWLLFYLVLINNAFCFNPFGRITYIDVGQGDSSFIQLPYDKGNIMVDCYRGSLQFLKRKGIKNLECLILTHSHEDHIQEAEDILKQIEVKFLLVSKYDDLSVFKPFQRLVQEIILIESGWTFKIAGYDFQFLAPIKYFENTNNVSIVFKFKMGTNYFLFTGDMEEELEILLCQKYGDSLKSDFLKVGHHGSKTSSTKKFISLVQPKYSIISLGEYNKFGFPHAEVYHQLKDSKIFQTNKVGNIGVICNKKQCNISGYRE